VKSIKIIQNQVSLHEGETPHCKDGDVIIRMGACGICGSDLSNIMGISCKPTTKIGHEVAGTIIKIGQKIKDFKVGDRVFVHHHASCGKCYLCRSNKQTLCEKFVDSLEPCGMAEEFLLPEWNVNQGCLFRIPESLSFEEATLIEPLACCLRAWKKIPHGQKSIAIFGIGPIGMIHALLAKYYGFKTIFCIDINKFRLNIAQKIGLQSVDFLDFALDEKISRGTNDIGVDIAIIATADMSTINKSLNIVRKGGIILLMGEPSYDSKCKIDISSMYRKEISMITNYASTNENIKEAVELISTNAINVRHLITHRFYFEETISAIDTAISKQDSLKVVILGNRE